MEGMKDVLSVLSGLLFIAGFIPYILAIFRGETKPAKASWIIWAILDTITLAGMYVQGTANGQIFGAVVGAWSIVLLAVSKYGSTGWTSIDKFCLGGAASSITLWGVFGSPSLGIAVSVVVIFLGSIPTFVSASKDPGREDKLAWTIFWVSCVCAVIAIKQWTIADIAQPLTFFIIESVMMCLLYFQPFYSGGKGETVP